MKKYKICKPVLFCAAVFAVCLAMRFMEYFVCRTDQTLLGENVLHKILGIVLLVVLLRVAGFRWGDIGFAKSYILKRALQGLLLGAVCFAPAYLAEWAILFGQSTPAHFELYISGFSITGSEVKNTAIASFLLCILFNLINVWMEEGIFRGFFITVIENQKGFWTANLFSALLFGLWHLAMPIRSWIDGEMSFLVMALMGIGYIFLSGIMSVKWGLLYHMTGSLWLGMGDHFFNNAVATNMLHVVSSGGADEWQIVRVLLAQAISFLAVMVIYWRKKEA